VFALCYHLASFAISAALRHTFNVHTDPSLLDVAGALAALPDLSLQDVAQADAGTGESDAGSRAR
jgi:hypothetical protein